MATWRVTPSRSLGSNLSEPSAFSAPESGSGGAFRASGCPKTLSQWKAAETRPAIAGLPQQQVGRSVTGTARPSRWSQSATRQSRVKTAATSQQQSNPSSGVIDQSELTTDGANQSGSSSSIPHIYSPENSARTGSAQQESHPLASIPLDTHSAAGTPLIPPRVLVDCFEVQQCEGLSGHVSISGAKNSALAVLAGAICSEEPLVLRRIPDLHDIRRMFQVLQSVGVKVQRGVDGLADAVLVDASNLTSVEPCPDVVRKLRASFFVIGALVGRKGEAIVPLPGGCNIGARPIDLHVRGLEALGANVEISQGKVHVKAKNGRLTGGHFYLDFPSVGATETLMMAACFADGDSILSNVAQEPEVVDLADFLISCGAEIKGAGSNTIAVRGRNRLGATDFTIIPDRIETGTFLVAGAITRSSITMSPVIPKHLTSVISKLRAIGCRIWQTDIQTLQITPGPGPLRASDMTTLPYPGFPTDLQPQLMSLLSTCKGQSVIKETVFESRMRHVEELQKMGAKIKVSGSTAIISGMDQGSQLYGCPVAATDLRAGAALVLAGMAAGGTTHIEGVSHIDRGYERLDEKLRGLGAKIQRLPCLPSELRI